MKFYSVHLFYFILFQQGMTLRNICNILMRKITKRRIITAIFFMIFASVFIWMLDDIEREKLKLRFAKYATPIFAVKRPLRNKVVKKEYWQLNFSIPGVVDDIMAMVINILHSDW